MQGTMLSEGSALCTRPGPFNSAVRQRMHITDAICRANNEANAHTIRGAPGRIQIYTSSSGPEAPAVQWDQNNYNCNIFGVICGNNGFGDNLEDKPQTTNILGSG